VSLYKESIVYCGCREAVKLLRLPPSQYSLHQRAEPRFPLADIGGGSPKRVCYFSDEWNMKVSGSLQ
jgi:hypothetical protein